MQGAIDVLEHLLGEVKDPEIPPEAFPPSPVDTDS